MPYIDLSIFDNGQRRLIRDDLGEDRILADGADPGLRFRLGGAVHMGGNGVVFRARRVRADGTIGGVVAIKMLKALSDSARDRFTNERRILAHLRHWSISPMLASGTYRSERAGCDVPWLATDLCGSNLRQHVVNDGPLTVARLRNVAYQLCDALQCVHEHEIIHRDLKPANVVWAAGQGENGAVKLIDFGIAKFITEDVSGRPLDDLTQTADFVGPVFFSSPELIAYAEDKGTSVDHRSDLFQFGKLLWYLATGRVLAGIPSVRADPTNGPLHALLMRLIADDPVDRPDSANVVRAEIEAWPRLG